MPNTIQ